MEIEYLVAVAISGLALISGLIQAAQRLKEVQGRIDKVHTALVMQSQRLRKAGRSSLNLIRDIRSSTHRRDQLEVELEDLDARLAAARKVDHRVYVLDDRRTRTDRSWIVTIANPHFGSINPQATTDAVKTWQEGRRFLVWALDAAKGRDKAAARYPDRQGYRIVSVTEQKTEGQML